jgi:hypothetical protein
MNRLLARSARGLLAVPLLALVMQVAPGSTSPVGELPTAGAVAQARGNFIKVMSAHAVDIGKSRWVSPGAQPSTNRGAVRGAITTAPSANWSGYVDVETGSQRIQNVSGSWTIPAVSCLPAPYQNQNAFVANWVGIDGFTSSTVEQVGTAAQCFEGIEYYYVWYEMYPGPIVEAGTAACIGGNVDCPEPGDQISASVSVTPAAGGENLYKIRLTDYTTPAESFAGTSDCSACLDSSAEWIVERPAYNAPFGFQILPLGDFGTTQFTTADLVSGGALTDISGFRGGPIYDVPMVDDTDAYYLDCIGQPYPPGTLLTTAQGSSCPITLPSSTSGFQVTWDSSF